MLPLLQARAPPARPCRFYMSPMGCRYGNACHFLHMDGTPQAVAMPTMIHSNGPVMMTPNPVYVAQTAPAHYTPSDQSGIPCRFFK